MGEVPAEDKNHVEKNVTNGSIPVTEVAGDGSGVQQHQIDKIDIEIASKYAQSPQINSDDGPLTQAYARAIGQLAGQVATGKDVTEADIKAALDGVQDAALAREAAQPLSRGRHRWPQPSPAGTRKRT